MKCDKCDKEGMVSHSCPYQSDINEDREYQCNCCEDCTNECAMDI
jgi:hypothetical protein